MPVKSELAFLTGQSSMACLIREKQWEGTPLGPPEQWPQSLRSVVGLMLGSAFPMFVAWGPQLNTLYNDGYAEIMGAKHPAGLGQPFLDIWHEITDDLYPLTQRIQAGEAFYIENMPLRMLRHGYAEDTWFTFSWSPVRDEAGRIAGIYCACTETTRMLLAERHLRAREEWLRTLFDQAPGFAAVVRGPQHVFEMANDAYQAITGNRELVGKPIALALPEMGEQGFVDKLDRVYESGVPFVGRSFPVSIQQGPDNPAHVLAYVDFMYQPLLDAAGKVQGIFIQGHDVTEQHRAQQALREADQQKDEFLATLAHELRNPLAPLRSAAHVLSTPGASAESRAHATDVIARQVGHMSRLLDDLIDIARITQRRLLLKKEHVQVGSLVDAALEAARPLADAKHHALAVNVENRSALVLADPVRMTQVLSNLLNNASKYTDPGGRIELAARADGDMLQFSITDNGIGLSQDALDTLFVMFAQEKAALERSEGGLGIGLALVKGLVELHGGTVEARSAGAGHGSCFIVKIPRTVDTPPPAQDGSAPHSQPCASARTVLLADDNRDACDMLAELLRMDGHTVDTAYDGKEAAEMAIRLRPDVLVLDIGMPGLNGYEVARRVRAQPWGDQPLIVAATGWGQEQDRQKATDAGFDLHLTKPFDPQALAGIIARRTRRPADAL